ncbi:hypothetical protein ABB37_08357 [Leptomonas pyrrhocoris]|uniref:Uncharacterized protein n=1 Tax=Leptomonas pyrrhocoris TaxID=157538 RepID=A0A0M9FTN7_LEPPY|nr:hypothetical protein ABB37_08357 [Leptomonas pyrrhocoris]KPA75845.1 hypothetical protein ABB37_08357 [Leptomonas pyrrhocoris]|eukprot:XP_015654284.1 hypothetical protein ABB37_08357 [Leptomonas pyrrhocoris]
MLSVCYSLMLRVAELVARTRNENSGTRSRLNYSSSSSFLCWNLSPLRHQLLRWEMDVPFIAVDTRTGFHLASHNLKAIDTQARSKEALAVLCNSVLLLWKNVNERSEEESFDETHSTFVVESSNLAQAALTTQYFHAHEHVLCVVFGSQHHVLYEIFADHIAAAINARTKFSKDGKAVNNVARAALSDAFQKQCSNLGIVDAVLVVKGPMKRFSLCHGHLANSSEALDAYISAGLCSGIFTDGSLQCLVCSSGPVRCVVAAPDTTLESIEKIADDNFMLSWALNLGLGD